MIKHYFKILIYSLVFRNLNTRIDDTKPAQICTDLHFLEAVSPLTLANVIVHCVHTCIAVLLYALPTEYSIYINHCYIVLLRQAPRLYSSSTSKVTTFPPPSTKSPSANGTETTVPSYRCPIKKNAYVYVYLCLHINVHRAVVGCNNKRG